MIFLEFVASFFREAKKLGLHTALDTSGIVFDINHKNEFKDLLSVTDLVLLDIKHINTSKHKALCGFENENVLKFLEFLSELKINVQIRYVLVPGITDDEKDLVALGKHLAMFKNITALEILPYHTLGVQKYKNLGINYPLDNIPQASKESAVKAREIILTTMKK